MTPNQVVKQIKILEKQMQEHAKNLEFEQAAAVRDQIIELESLFKKDI